MPNQYDESKWPHKWIWKCPICGRSGVKPSKCGYSRQSGMTHMMTFHKTKQDVVMIKVTSNEERKKAIFDER